MKNCASFERLLARPFLADQIDRELAGRRLSEFVRLAWPVIEPATPFVPGWHIDAIIEHLEAVTAGQIHHLLINVPPRHMKSLLVAVFWPGWEWIRWPQRRWLFSSYGAQLSIRDSLRCRRLIESPWYQTNWGDRFRLTSDQNTKGRFDNDHSGYRLATSVGGAATGEGGDRVVCDDPHNVQEAESDAVRKATLDWWDVVMSTRVRTPSGESLSIPAVPLPARFDQVAQSWDMAFKDTVTADYVVGQVWGALQADRFLLDQKRDRLNMPATVAAVKALSERWPQAGAKLIEDKANGSAVIAELEHEIPGLIAVNPEGGKIARAQAVSPQVESGNVYLPHPAMAPWVDGLIEECAAFPNGAYDDQVDAMTQALNRMRSGSGVFGLVEYIKQLSAAGGGDAIEGKPANSEKAPNGGACPACGSTAIGRVFGSWRCHQCGWQPPSRQDVIPNAPLRRMVEKVRSRW